jgi:RF-1 domain
MIRNCRPFIVEQTLADPEAESNARPGIKPDGRTTHPQHRGYPHPVPANPAIRTHPCALDDDALLAQCTLARGRSSGPGGQHRNKVQTQVTLTHKPTGLSARAGERRTGAENKRVALKRLRLTLAIEYRCDVPDVGLKGDVRSALWQSRVKDGRIVVSESHRDLPTLLAEALDMLAATEFDHKEASVRLACTPSQLVKLLKKHQPALNRANAERDAQGLAPLR